MTLEYTFRKAGYKVFVARDGTEVLEIMEKEIPDFILLDIMMPKMDGYTTLDYIKKQEKFQHIKSIFLSAKTSPEDI
jgi:CheY-like chemotaxis protein